MQFYAFLCPESTWDSFNVRTWTVPAYKWVGVDKMSTYLSAIDRSINQHLLIERFTPPESVTKVPHWTATAKVRSPHRLILNLAVVLMASGKQRPVQVWLIHPVTVSARPLSGSSLPHIPNKFKDRKQIACQAMETWITLTLVSLRYASYVFNVLIFVQMGNTLSPSTNVLLECANNAPMPQTGSGSKFAAGDCELCTVRPRCIHERVARLPTELIPRLWSSATLTEV